MFLDEPSQQIFFQKDSEGTQNLLCDPKSATKQPYSEDGPRPPLTPQPKSLQRHCQAFRLAMILLGFLPVIELCVYMRVCLEWMAGCRIPIGGGVQYTSRHA